jgi:predicted HicB family RNase H-like nuclease
MERKETADSAAPRAFSVRLFSVRLPVWLCREFKIRAAQEGKSMQSAVAEMIAEYLKKKA